MGITTVHVLRNETVDCQSLPFTVVARCSGFEYSWNIAQEDDARRFLDIAEKYYGRRCPKCLQKDSGTIQVREWAGEHGEHSAEPEVDLGCRYAECDYRGFAELREVDEENAERLGWEAESGFQSEIIDLAEENRWRCYHVSNVQGRLINPTAAGFPDLVLARKGEHRLLVVECKREDGELRPSQERWLAVLRSIPGVDARVWRPSDWPEIRRVLTQGADGVPAWLGPA